MGLFVFCLFASLAIVGVGFPIPAMFVNAQRTQHVHPEVLPPEWNRCCDQRDCHRGQVSIRYLNQETAFVAIEHYKPFTVPASKVFKSTDGWSYFCRINVDKPPSTDNIRCIFIAAGGYASR